MINSAVILGRLVADPELKVTPTGTKTVSFTVAVDRRYSKDGERQADFIDVVAWRHTAEFICSHFKKGSIIGVQAYIQTRTYEDRNGNKRKAVELIAENISFGGDKGRSASDRGYPEEPPEYFDIPEEQLPY